MITKDPDAPYQLAFFDTHLLVKFKRRTRITPELIHTILSEEFNLPKRKVINDIWDLRECLEGDNIDSNSMIRIVNYITEKFNPNLLHKKTAIVVDKEVAYGLTRMFQILAEDLPYDIEIFKSTRDAIRWIET